jgi:hypothetical protein
LSKKGGVARSSNNHKLAALGAVSGHWPFSATQLGDRFSLNAAMPSAASSD